jgi:hypothetical protein
MAAGNEEKPVDLGALARSVQLALLITDAALPLYGAPRGATADSQEMIVMDRSRLRGIAFTAVLREMNRFECTITSGALEALMDRRVPEAGL